MKEFCTMAEAFLSDIYEDEIACCPHLGASGCDGCEFFALFECLADPSDMPCFADHECSSITCLNCSCSSFILSPG